MTADGVGEYRAQPFWVEARHDGRTWIGHYRLLGVEPELARRAAEAGRHQWTPINPGWATRLEAESNAGQAAHAAIDALSLQGQLPPA